MEFSAQLGKLVAAVEHNRNRVPPARAMLVGISGIDGSGKSAIAPRVVEQLTRRGVRAQLIQLDEWHNPPAVRFDPQRPAETFYQRGLRHAELFDMLVLPLQRERRLRLQAVISRLPDEQLFTHTFAFDNVEVIVLEGIFIFKRQFQARFDFRCWVECPFHVALARALRRNQEGLLAAAIVRDYESIYFPAQRLHFELDRPRDGVDFVFHNGADVALVAEHNRLERAAAR